MQPALKVFRLTFCSNFNQSIAASCLEKTLFVIPLAWLPYFVERFHCGLFGIFKINLTMEYTKLYIKL